MPQPNRQYEIRNNLDGTLDEVVAKGCHFHLEQMDDGHWWIGIDLPDGQLIHINLTSNAKILASVEEDA